MKTNSNKAKTKNIESSFKPNWSKSKKNKIILGSFLTIIFITIIMKIIVTILWDTGYYNGKFHLWYWHDEGVNQLLKNTRWGEIAGKDKIEGTKFSVSENKEFAHRAKVHPYFFWSLTQFTWQTTLLITFILCFRLFMYDDRVPKWLRWTHSQKTLSIVTMYDIIVCIVFWAALSKNFGQLNDSSDGVMSALINTSTILVHAVIPACMVIYSLIYLLSSTEASRLNKKFLFLGIIYPTGYVCFYVLMSVIWLDPYPISNLATTHDFSQLWIAFLAIVGIFIGLWVMMFVHNEILFKFNKKNKYEYDYELVSDLNTKLDKWKWKVEKSKRKIKASVNETLIKKEKVALAKRELGVIKIEYSINKIKNRAERHEKEYKDTTKRKQEKNNSTKSTTIKKKPVNKNIKKKVTKK